MYRMLFATGLLVLFTTSVEAHHGVATGFDVTSDVEINGVITSFSWRNPHVVINVSADEGTDSEESWLIVSGSVSMLKRMGVTPELLPVGKQVRIAGHTARSGDNAMYMNHMLLTDGRELIFKRGATARWSKDSIGDSDKLHGKVVEADIDKRPDSIFAVWTTVYNDPVSHYLFPGNDNLPQVTESARKLMAGFDFSESSPFSNCAPKGMPFAMSNPYPIELLDAGDNIIIKLEEYDAVREIHMRDKHDDKGIAPSTLGYSTGRWESDTLIVTTTKIDYGFLIANAKPLPIPQSANVHVEERFSLSSDHNRLDYEVLITDPEILTAPMKVSKYFQWQPGAKIQPYDCSED